MVFGQAKEMNVIKSIALTPLWIAQVFTQTKSYRDNPIIGSRTMNRLGLGITRIVIAYGMHKFRMALLAPLVEPKYRKMYKERGYICIENFLSSEDFAEIERTVNNAKGEVRECVQGDTLTLRILLDDEALAKMPALRKLVDNPLYERLCKYVASFWKRPLYYIQNIKNGFASGKPDPQKVLHADAYFPSMKAWFFINDVEPDHGPFTYVPTSHRLTWKRIKWEYKHSIDARDADNAYSAKGSMRYTLDDLHEMDLPEPVAMVLKKNSLVVGDVFGIHCRGSALKPCNRLELWAYSRSNPFNPFPGFGSKLRSKAEYRLAKAYWRWQDRRAAKRNGQSSWHLVQEDKFHDAN